MKRIQDNTVEITFATGEIEKGRLDLPKERIKTSADILAGILLDFVNGGGNIDALTPENVFGKKEIK
ncbi:MAG: hypothetical protein PUK83_05630 [Clostridia bacterium]|nr:hypothetical protein [Clostridia bacterium]MDY5264021.1 hypothetical protein [Eubacteriales bacterium]